MKRISKLLLLLSALLQMACTKEHVTSRPYPRVRTQSPTNITSSGAEFHGEITFTTAATVTNKGFVWSLNEVPTFENSDSISLGVQSGTLSFSTIVNRAMIPGLTYYVRAFVIAAPVLIYGDVVSFTSQGSVAPYSITNIIAPTMIPRIVATVYGNFGAISQVKVGDTVVPSANITGATPGHFYLKLPDLTKNNSTLSIVTDGQELVLTKKLSMILSYRNTKGPSGGNYSSANFFAGNKEYTGFGYAGGGDFPYLTNSFYYYDLQKDTFVSLNQSTISARFAPIAFSINDVGYIAGGHDDSNNLNDFYSVDPASNAITRLNDLPFTGTVIGFTIKNKAYCLNYVATPTPTNQLYEFDPVTDLWTRRADYPGVNKKIVYGFTLGLFSFVQNDIGFIGQAQSVAYGVPLGDIWGYDPDKDLWTLAMKSDIVSYGACGVVVSDGKTYLYNRQLDTDEGDYTYYTQFYEFQSDGKTLAITPYTTSLLFNPNGYFSIGNSGYFYTWSALWEFHPTL